MNKTRILFLDQDYEFGGAQQVLVDLIKGLDREKFEIYFAGCNKGKVFEKIKSYTKKISIVPLSRTTANIKRESFNLFYLLSNSWQLLFFIYRLAGYLLKEKINIVYTNTVETHICGSLSGLVTFKKVVWRLHDIISSDANFSKASIKIISRFARLFPVKILCVSKAVRNSLVANGVKQGKIDVIYNGIKIKNNNGSLEEKYKFKKEAFVFGWIGRITKVKAPNLFIQAASRLTTETDKKCRFVIIGEADEGENEYYSDLVKLKEKLNLNDKLFFKGYTNEPLRVIRNLDVIVHTSIWPDPLPTVILEGMICKKPVIASDVGGVREILSNKKEGIIYEKGSIKDLTRAMQFLLDNPLEAELMAENGFKRAASFFNYKKYIRKIEAVLEHKR